MYRAHCLRILDACVRFDVTEVIENTLRTCTKVHKHLVNCLNVKYQLMIHETVAGEKLVVPFLAEYSYAHDVTAARTCCC